MKTNSPKAFLKFGEFTAHVYDFHFLYDDDFRGTDADQGPVRAPCSASSLAHPVLVTAGLNHDWVNTHGVSHELRLRVVAS